MDGHFPQGHLSFSPVNLQIDLSLVVTEVFCSVLKQKRLFNIHIKSEGKSMHGNTFKFSSIIAALVHGPGPEI